MNNKKIIIEIERRILELIAQRNQARISNQYDYNYSEFGGIVKGLRVSLEVIKNEENQDIVNPWYYTIKRVPTQKTRYANQFLCPVTGCNVEYELPFRAIYDFEKKGFFKINDLGNLETEKVNKWCELPSTSGKQNGK